MPITDLMLIRVDKVLLHLIEEAAKTISIKNIQHLKENWIRITPKHSKPIKKLAPEPFATQGETKGSKKQTNVLWKDQGTIAVCPF